MPMEVPAYQQTLTQLTAMVLVLMLLRCLQNRVLLRCGDRQPEEDGFEECDDGNQNENDGCDNSCVLPLGAFSLGLPHSQRRRGGAWTWN